LNNLKKTFANSLLRERSFPPISFISIENSKGPKVESCWTPAETSQTVDDVALLIIFLLSLIQIIFKPFD
jgi:hypothetical protein